jgi:hypothetical protein
VSDFGAYWSCSWIEIKGGQPLASSYTPVFVNDMSQYSDEGCASSVSSPHDGIVEPLNPVVDAVYMKPKGFQNGKVPEPLTPDLYGGQSPSTATPSVTTESPTVEATTSTDEAKPTGTQPTVMPLVTTQSPTVEATTSADESKPTGTQPTVMPSVTTESPTVEATTSVGRKRPIRGKSTVMPTMTTESPTMETATSVDEAKPTGAKPTGPSDLYLQLYKAGIPYDSGAAGPTLTDGMNICADDYDSGFSIWCMGAPEGSTVTFYVDDEEERVEARSPYAIAGDAAGKTRRWRNVPEGSATIKCSTDADADVYAEVAVDFSCKDQGHYY